jgi:biotin transporter BioY
VQFVGTIVLLAPFVAVALVCAFAEKHARTRSVLVIFALATLTLLYFYFQGYQAAERAMLQKMWTAAALSIGLLPFFIGVPVVLAAIGAGALAAKFDRRVSA